MIRKKTICYWSPFIDKVATVNAVINSALSVNSYLGSEYESLIINCFGEWDKNFKQKYSNLNFYNFKNINFLFSFSSKGFFKSRIKYIIIFIFSFISLKNFLLKKKPDFIIIHLVTSLPLFINFIFNLNTKLILRISGKPKLNFFRYIFWKITLKKIHKITFPTVESLNYFKNLGIVDNNKIELLYDPVFSIKKISNKNRGTDLNIRFRKKSFYLSIGRLTRQKNFIFLIKCFSRLVKNDPSIKLLIIGSGENKEKMERLIEAKNLKKNIILLGYQENVFKYLRNCKAFILSSLWEDPGFVLIEAILSNCLVLSSDCPSGPKEILDNRSGVLFKSNSVSDFIFKFNELENLTVNEKKKIRFNAKKKIRNYSIFYHSQNLKRILASLSNF